MLEAHFLHFPLENGPLYRYVETPPQDSNQESSDSHLFSSKKRSRLLVQEERTLHPHSLCLGSVAKKKARALHPRSLCLGSAAKKKANRVMPLFSGKEESKRIRTKESSDSLLSSSKKSARLLVKEERTLHHRNSTQEMRRLRKLLMRLLLVQEE